MTDLKFSQAMAAARLIPAPVAVLTTIEKTSGKTLATITTAAYAQLEPLSLSTAVLTKSRTGRAILESKSFGLSMVAFEQLSKLEKMSLLSAGQDQDKLTAAGFERGKFEQSQVEYVKDCLAAFSLTLVGQIEMENYIGLIGRVDEVMHIEDPTALNLTALIRYNRCYGPIDKTRLKDALDSYPI